MGIILAPKIVSIFFMFIGIMKVHYVMVAEFAYYCNLFTHEALRSSWELFETCPCVPDRIGISKC